eukprot:scaffold225470_cov64-Attheya_sp.AAC.1
MYRYRYVVRRASTPCTSPTITSTKRSFHNHAVPRFARVITNSLDRVMMMSSRECANWLVRTLAVLIVIAAGSHNCAVMAQEAGIRDITIWKPLRKLTDPIQRKYNELPGEGKMVTGAFVGFTASRVAVKSITSCIKFAGAAFVA